MAETYDDFRKQWLGTWKLTGHSEMDKMLLQLQRSVEQSLPSEAQWHRWMELDRHWGDWLRL